jgi:hypothetical protein
MVMAALAVIVVMAALAFHFFSGLAFLKQRCYNCTTTMITIIITLSLITTQSLIIITISTITSIKYLCSIDLP